jgi:ABC-type multidrug transport system fused ATPase/permease subunit
MSALKTKYKVLMFLSSYTPLFLILLLRVLSQIVENITSFTKDNIIEYISSHPTTAIIIVGIVLVIVIPNIIIELILRDTKSTTNPKDLQVNSIQKMNHIYMEYLVSYIIPFLSLNFSNFFDMIALFLLLITFCIIYININFNIRGYNLYKIIDEKNNEYMTLSKKKPFEITGVLRVRDISESDERFVLDIEG